LKTRTQHVKRIQSDETANETTTTIGRRAPYPLSIGNLPLGSSHTPKNISGKRTDVRNNYTIYE